MRSCALLVLLVACSRRDPAPERRTPDPPPAAAPAPPPTPLPPTTATSIETITAFVDAARRRDYLMPWFAAEITMSAQCDTKEMTPTYAWVWLDGAKVTWPAAHVCTNDCCVYTWAKSDGEPQLDGVTRRICANAGRITELKMWCADVDPMH